MGRFRFYNELIWFVVNTLVFWWMLRIVENLEIFNVLVSSIVISLGLVLASLIVKEVKNPKKYRVRLGNTLFWWLINFTIILPYNLFIKLQGNFIWHVILGGFLITTATHFISKIKRYKRKKILWIPILFLILIYIILNPDITSINNSINEKFNLVFVQTNEVSNQVKNIFTIPENDYGKVENKILQLVNQERSRNNVAPLIIDPNLNKLTRDWSEKMITENFFEHSNYNVGENIGEVPIHSNVVGCGSTYSNDEMAECFVIGWIESIGHHQNMIDPSYSITGVGIACDNSKCRATQMFS